MNPGMFLLLATLGLVAGMFSSHRNARFWLVLSLSGAGAALAAAVWVLAGGGDWEWRSAFLIGGQPVHLRLDGVSAFFLALLSVLGGAATIYMMEYWTDKAHPASAPSGRVWWNALLVFMGLVLVMSNGLHFLIMWELFTVSAYFLITRERHRRAVRAAGWLYLAASHTSALFLFAFLPAWRRRPAAGNWGRCTHVTNWRRCFGWRWLVSD
jgi:hydrogenase-4 component B